VAQKIKPLPIYQYIVIKPAEDIRELFKHCNIIAWY